MRVHGEERRDLVGGVLAAQHVADGQLLLAPEEAVLAHPGVVEDLREIGAPAVGEDHGDHRVGVVDLARHLVGGAQREPAGAAGEDALRLRQPARPQEGVLVGDGHVAVDDRWVVGVRPEVLADALDEVRLDALLAARVDRADRVGPDDLDGGVLLAQVAPDAGDRAAGPDPHDQVGDLAAGLAPQLRARGAVVHLRVGRVAVLVRLERARDLLGEAIGDAVVRLGRLGRDVGRRDDDLGAVRAQQVDLLLGHLVRHHGDHAVALQRGGDREPGAGVAARRLDDRPARPQQPVALGGLDQGDRDAVLDRSAGVERLELRDELRTQVPSDPRQPHQRRVADHVEDGVADLPADGGGGRHGVKIAPGGLSTTFARRE